MSRDSDTGLPWKWLLPTGASAVLAIAGSMDADLHWLHYLCKPLTTLLIAAMAWQASQPLPAYRQAILAGLLLSTLGDIWLMLPQDYFVFGLGSFLFAHLAYLYALTRHRPLQPWRWPYLAYALIAGLVLAVLWPKLPDPLRLPVVFYVVVLAVMAAQAAAMATRQAHAGALLAAVGGLSFVVSDALLAIDRFHTPLPYAPVLVLASYWHAQFLIARSVCGSGTATR